jgi:phage FluMu protein Com
MHTLPFAEYRCSCGRLLFKGLVLSGHVQVKCKRCREVVLFDQPLHVRTQEISSEIPDSTSYSLLVDSKGHIKDASVSAVHRLGYSREALCTMMINDVPAAQNSESEIIALSSPEPLTVYFYREEKDECVQEE